MKKLLIAALALTLALALTAGLLGGAALAAKDGYEIDVPAMKALEQGSQFPVRVVLKKVVEEYFTTSYGDPKTALLSFTLENGSDSEIAAMTIYFVAYDDDSVTRDITPSSGIGAYYGRNEQPELKTLPLSELAFAPGTTYVTGLAVDWKRFTGVRAIVAEYTTADGTVVQNPDFTAWQTLAFGMVSQGAVELD